MRRVVTDEGLDLRKLGRQRRSECAAVAEETEAGTVQRLDLGPLLSVFGRWGLKRPAHLMELAAAARTGCSEFRARCDLEALAAVKAGVGNQILRAWHARGLHRRLTPELSRVAKQLRLG